MILKFGAHEVFLRSSGVPGRLFFNNVRGTKHFAAGKRRDGKEGVHPLSQESRGKGRYVLIKKTRGRDGSWKQN